LNGILYSFNFAAMSLLYIVPTPIGNLEDISYRCLNVLKQVDYVLAEDTRVTKKLFLKYDIFTSLSSFHTYNEHKVLKRWINVLTNNKKVALVSDAGTPAISDPGFLLVRECIKNNIEVICLPGPTAFVPALVMSGIPMNNFVFEGFLPLKKGRISKLKFLEKEERTMVFYESPHRILKTLSDLIMFFGKERHASISREISKTFEETKRGSLIVLLEFYKQNKPKGEFVIIIEGKNS